LKFEIVGKGKELICTQRVHVHRVSPISLSLSFQRPRARSPFPLLFSLLSRKHRVNGARPWRASLFPARETLDSPVSPGRIQRREESSEEAAFHGRSKRGVLLFSAEVIPARESDPLYLRESLDLSRASGWVISSPRYRSSIERRGGPATPMPRRRGRFVCRRRPAAGVIPGSFLPSLPLPYSPLLPPLSLSLSLFRRERGRWRGGGVDLRVVE